MVRCERFFDVVIDAFVDDFDFFCGDFENFFDVFFSVFGYGDDFFCLSDGVIDDQMVGQAVERRGHFFAGIEGKREVVNGHDRWPAVKKRRVEMGEMHQIEMLLVKEFEEFCLLAEGVMAGVHEDFGDAAVWRRESGIFGFVKEENVFVFVIDLEKIFGQLKNVAADAGESGGVHSAVYADAHGGGLTRGSNPYYIF